MILFILQFLLSSNCRADSDAAFVKHTQTLKQNGIRLDQLLQRAGVRNSNENELKLSDPTSESTVSLIRVHGRLQESIINVGKILYGKILNRLVVGGEGSPVLIVLDTDQERFSGLRILGSARQGGTPGRVSVEFKQLVLRDGRSIAISGVGLDRSGAFGLEAQVFSQKAWAIGGAIASSFISGVAASGQTQTQSAFGFSQPQVSGRNSLLQGLAQTTADQSKRLLDESTQEKPVLVIEPDTSVAVLNQEEVRL